MIFHVGFFATVYPAVAGPHKPFAMKPCAIQKRTPWLTSVWLEMPHALKTLLENLLKLYDVVPFRPACRIMVLMANTFCCCFTVLGTGLIKMRQRFKEKVCVRRVRV